MKSQKKTAAIALAAAAMISMMPMHAHADASGGLIWAANPAGVQAMPDAQALALLPSSGYVPLETAGGKCLLVARRGTKIVAVELSPLAIGTKIIGWKPQEIDMSTLTSKWGYVPPKSSIDTKSFGNPVTNTLSAQSKTDTSKGGTFARASSWSNGNVEAHSSAIASANGETEAAESVTVNGKTYRKYSHFKPATADAPVAASDEYFCQ
ncbi:hypothetical protein A9R05_20520 [Burkholderia sp. KK1]|uniref:Uncharacterized protein n=1 Tax=Caballeronia cordobensis TaxID=1353886 RepID=A0A158HUC5_CABCO|nr:MULTISPECIES: hypothetical protein [Caballeronia]AQH02017.1 hypothetical protein A9R05_20520 [Burkholderia sp. KK1]BBP98335.1 hypothetical protein BSFA1_34640 [Burkholderia sp. SFA1]MCE4544654.1 hypothetical protein [Caballeronia sp. PC1]MCE4571805.1 hypothetical protein [Caballeronia sp. CLC5]SAL47936.1 hypothetical protein AWB70_03817 [Caballeronia cordobensis]